MLRGELCSSMDARLIGERKAARDPTAQINSLEYGDMEGYNRLRTQLFPNARSSFSGRTALSLRLWVQPLRGREPVLQFQLRDARGLLREYRIERHVRSERPDLQRPPSNVCN